MGFLLPCDMSLPVMKEKADKSWPPEAGGGEPGGAS